MAFPEFPGRRPWVLVDWGVRYPLGARLQEHPRGCDQADGDGTAVALKSQVYAGAETPGWPVAPSIQWCLLRWSLAVVIVKGLESHTRCASRAHVVRLYMP
jgi:hypothetical protein